MLSSRVDEEWFSLDFILDPGRTVWHAQLEDARMAGYLYETAIGCTLRLLPIASNAEDGDSMWRRNTAEKTKDRWTARSGS